MINVENIEVFNFEGAIRGMRNPMDSWDKSDSFAVQGAVDIGEKDLGLMKRLYKGGTEHRKFMRQIFVSMDVTAPRYWWIEFDTYKVGVTSNSCSTMHTIHKRDLTLDDFSTDQLEDFSWNRLQDLITHINICRQHYVDTKDEKYWWQIIQLLPQSFNQRRTVTFNYENAATIINQRQSHKLDEWRQFVDELKKMPYLDDIMDEVVE